MSHTHTGQSHLVLTDTVKQKMATDIVMKIQDVIHRETYTA